jgi:tape measure domain-containing protein
VVSSGLDFKVTASTASASSQFANLSKSMANVSASAENASASMQALSKPVRLSVQGDEQVQAARDEITRLREQMRSKLELDINADTRDEQRKIAQLQSKIKTLEKTKPEITPEIHDLPVQSKLASIKAKLASLVGLRPKIPVDVDVQGEQDLGKVQGKLSSIGDAVGGELTGKLEGMAGGLAGVASAAGPAGLAIGAAVGAVGGLAVGLGKAIVPMVQLADTMENNKIAFDKFLGSGDKADAFLSDLQSFAAETPFEFPELVESSKRLLAFGINGKQIIPLMSTLGDAAALTGSSVDDLATIWGQMSAKGKVANEELLQLTERGIPAYQILADKMGKPVSEIQKLASEGKLGAKQMKLLQQGMNETFGGGMAKQAQTLSGQISTLKDNFKAMQTQIGGALLPIVKEFMPLLNDAMSSLGDWVTANGPAIAGVFTQIGSATIELVSQVDTWASAYKVAFLQIKSGAEALAGSITTTFGNLAAQIGAVVSKIPGMEGIGNAISDAGEKAQQVGGAMTDMANKDSAAAEQTKKNWQARQKTYGDVKKKIEAAGAAAKKGAQLNADTAEAQKKIDAVSAKIKKLKSQRASAKLDSDKSAFDKKIKAAEADLKKLKGQKTNLVVDAKIADTQSKLTTVKAKLAELRKQKTTPEVRADISQLEAQQRKAKARLADLQKQKVQPKITAKDDTSAGVNSAKRNLNSVQDKTVTITTKRVVKQTSANLGYDIGSAKATQASPSAYQTAAPVVHIHVRDEALAGFIDVRFAGNAARASKVVHRKDPVHL